MKDTSLWSLLRCPLCGATLRRADEEVICGIHRFPIEGGIPRLLPPDLMRVRKGTETVGVRARTYRSFGFEWQRFSTQLSDYRDNFNWYFEPLELALGGLRVLDAGCGMGRHTNHLLRAGAAVIGLDASPAIDVAARNNTHGDALFVQGDLLKLPVQESSFDVVCCLGVLHHIEDTEGGLAGLVRAVRPGGWIVIYLYHDPSERSWWRGVLLSMVTLARRVTTRLPMEPLRILTGLLAAGLFAFYILPARVLAKVPGLAQPVRGLPLGQYLDYRFRVLWNDQFDRFSAPLEKRYKRAEVLAMMQAAGVSDIRIVGGYGWRAAGRRPPTD